MHNVHRSCAAGPTRSVLRVGVWAWVLGAGLAPVLGCFDTLVDASVNVRCEGHGQCPPGYVCQESVGRCIDASAAAREPPRLDGASVTPPFAREGALVVARFEADRALGPSPTVGLEVNGARYPLAAIPDETDAGARRYAFSLRAAPLMGGGEARVFATLVDDVGVTAPDILVGELELDFVVPRLTQPATLSPTPAGPSDTVVATFTTDEPLGPDPDVVLVVGGGGETPLILAQRSADGRTFQYRLDAGTVQDGGSWAVRGALADPAGNNITVDLGQAVFDLTAPGVSPEGSSTTAQGPVRAQRTVSVEVRTTEPATAEGLRAVPRDDPGATPLAFVPGTSTANVLVFSFTTSDDDHGVYDLELFGLRDSVGNEAATIELTPILGPLVVDTLEPGLAELNTSGESLTSSGALIVTLRPDEPLAAAPLVQLGNEVLNLDSASAEDPPLYTFLLDGGSTDLVGSFELSVLLTDLAGNVAFLPQGSIAIDAVPPQALSVSFQPPLARLGTTAVLSVVSSEALAEHPALLWQSDPPPAFVPLMSTSPTTWSWTLLIDDTMTDGDFLLDDVQLTDLAGNVGHALDSLTGPFSFAVDNLPPTINDVTLGSPYAYSLVAGHSVITVTFTVDEPLATTGAPLTVALGDLEMTEVAAEPAVDGTTTYSYTLDLATHAGAVAEGPELLTVIAQDVATNYGFAAVPVVLDFTPPDIVLGSESLLLLPSAQNPLDEVTAARADTTLRLTFTVDEPLAASPAVVSDPAGLVPTPLFEQGTTYAFQTLAGTASADAPHTFAVTLTDLAGNTGVAAADSVVTIDRAPPSTPAVGAADALIHHRIPWGSDETGPEPTAYLLGGPGALTEDGTVVIYESVPGTYSEVGRGPGQAGAAFGPIAIERPSAARVAVALVDEAGNSSGAVRVLDVVWRASLIAPEGVENPHQVWADGARATWRDFAHDPVDTDWALSLAAPGDGLQLTAHGAGRWQQFLGDSLEGGKGGAVVVDARRGRVVVFSGGETGADHRDTFEWNGLTWQEMNLTDPEGDGYPPPRRDPGAAFDPHREVTVLVGGRSAQSNELLDDVWEYNGTSWKRRPVEGQGPGRRAGLATAYEPFTQTLMVCGGEGDEGLTDDCWFLEEKGFALVEKGADFPSPRRDAAMVLDARRRAIILVGGTGDGAQSLQDTWRWDGKEWLQLDAEFPYGALNEPSLAFDPRRSEVLLLDEGQLFTLNGDAWTEAQVTSGAEVPAGAILRYDAGGGVLLALALKEEVLRAFVLRRGHWRELPVTDDASPGVRTEVAAAAASGAATLAFGGEGDPSTAATWSFAGGWGEVLGADLTSPPDRSAAAMAYSTSLGKVVLFGGDDKGNLGPVADTWELIGSTWTARGVVAQGPSPRADHAMVHDPLGQRALLFGGRANNNTVPAGLFAYDEGGWSSVSTPTQPSARYGHAMVWDGARDRALLLGGTDASGAVLGDVWQLKDADFEDITSLLTTLPPPRSHSRLAYDETADAVVLFGGRDGEDRRLDDTWVLENSDCRPLTISDPERDGAPLARESHLLFFDRNYGGVVLYGGSASVGGATSALGDGWLLDLGGRSRPGIGARFDLLGLALVDSTQVLRIDARAVAGGVGAGGNTAGAALEVWQDGMWLERATGLAPVTAPSQVAWAWTAEEEGPPPFLADRSLHLSVVPRADSNATPGAVALDYLEIELTLRYQDALVGSPGGSGVDVGDGEEIEVEVP